jgi:hypothetical protein
MPPATTPASRQFISEGATPTGAVLGLALLAVLVGLAVAM